MLCSFIKLNMKYVRKLTKVGGGRTYSVTLPISSIRKFGCLPVRQAREAGGAKQTEACN